MSTPNNGQVDIALTQVDTKTINIPITRVAKEHTQLTFELLSSSIASMEQDTDFKTGENKNINLIDEHRDIYSAKDDRTNNEITNSRLKEGVFNIIKGSNNDNRNVATRYKNHIKDNRDILFAKLYSMNNEVTRSNPKEDMSNSLTRPSDVNRNVSHTSGHNQQRKYRKIIQELACV